LKRVVGHRVQGGLGAAGGVVEGFTVTSLIRVPAGEKLTGLFARVYIRLGCS
jgi:hypothetical protein